MGPLYCPSEEVIITSLRCPFDLPSMTPGEIHNEWYHYYCSNICPFKKFLSSQFIASVEVSDMARCSSKSEELREDVERRISPSKKGKLTISYNIYFDLNM